ncbi:hypothetical protein SH139x_004765 [Planctomycetaceae bacterium SH139]
MPFPTLVLLRLGVGTRLIGGLFFRWLRATLVKLIGSEGGGMIRQ